MGKQRTVACIHIKLLKIEGILASQNIIDRQNPRAPVQGGIRRVPSLFSRSGQPRFDHLLICSSKCADIEIIIISLIFRNRIISPGNQRGCPVSLLLVNTACQVKRADFQRNPNRIKGIRISHIGLWQLPLHKGFA